MLPAVLAMAAVTSCSTPSSSPTAARVPGELVPPHLSNDGALSSGQVVVVNSNERHTLRVDYIRMTPDLGRSITSRADVPPGASVAIGPNTMNGNRCSYQISGWDKTHSTARATHVAKARAREKQNHVVAQTVADRD